MVSVLEVTIVQWVLQLQMHALLGIILMPLDQFNSQIASNVLQDIIVVDKD